MINWPLMDNANPEDQRVALSNFILHGDKFSQGKYEKE